MPSEHIWHVFGNKATAAMPPPGIDPKVILDLGCWRGTTSEIYLECFPEAELVSVDPDFDNIVAADYLYDLYEDRIVLLQCAVWGEMKMANFHRGRHSMTGCIEGTMDNPGDEVELIDCITIDQIMDAEDYDAIDFIKMDIEGSEFNVLEAGGDWTKKTKSIAVEIHQENNEYCRELLEGLGFRIVHEIPELLWAVNDNA